MIVLLPPTEYPASFPASNSASAPDVLKTAIMKCLSLSPLKRPLFPEVCLWLGLQDLEVQQKSQLMPATTPTITNTGDFKHYSLVPPTHEHSENKYPYTRYRPNDNVPTFNSIDGISLQDISPKQIQRFELFYEHEDNQFSPMRLAIDKKRRQLAAFTTRLIRRKKMLIICVVLVATLVLSISMILVFTSKSSASSATFTDDSRSSLQVVQSSTTTTPAQLFYPYTSAAGTASCEWNGIALFGFEDGMTLKLDLTTGALDRAFNSSIVARTGAAASSISIDENSGYICLIYNDGTVVMADLFSLTVSSIGGNGNNNPPSSSHSSSFCRQKLLYTFSNYNLVTSWDLFQNSPSNHLVQKYSYDSNDKVTSMTQGRNRFFVGTAGGAVWMSQLWSTSSGNQTLVAQGSGGSILFLQYHGSYVYSLNEAGIISLIHMYDFNISATLQLPNSVVQNGVVDFGVTDLFIYILTKTAGVFQVDPTEKKIMLLPFSIGGGSSTNMIISARHIYISGSLGGVFRIRIGVGSAKRDAELIGSTFFTRKMFSDHGAMFAEQGNGQVMRANLLLNNTEFVYNSSSSNLQPSTSIYSERASGFSCISYLNGVVSSFDGETVNWWYELETGVEQTDRSVVCQFPFVLFNQGTQFLRYKFYSPTYSYNVKLVSNHTFANKISALALGNDRIYLGDSAGSVAEYIISTDSIVTIIDGIAAQSTGVSFLRYCGTNLYVFYSNNSVAKIHTQSQSISYLKQLLPSLNIKITSITDVAVDADGIFIATGAVVYQTLEKTPEEVVVIYTNNNVSQLLVQNEYAYLATYNGVYILQLE